MRSCPTLSGHMLISAELRGINSSRPSKSVLLCAQTSLEEVSISREST